MPDRLMSTDEAAELLGVKPATIYSYVSRGRLESIRKPGAPTSWFRRTDVEHLAGSRRTRRTEPAHRPARSETAISEIDGYGYRYRGRDPVDLYQRFDFEQVAEFLWTGVIPEITRWLPREMGSAAAAAQSSLDPEALPLDRLRLAVSALAASDHLRFGRPSGALVVTARHLIADMVEALPLLGETGDSDGLTARLWPRLTDEPPTEGQLEALGKVLVVVADHGVAPSTLAARIAAAYRADLYGVVATGLAILAGAWHGGRALSAETMLQDIQRVGDAEVVVGDLFRFGSIPCLGQPRYLTQDPRTAMITEIAATAAPGHGALHALAEVSRITRERALPAPSMELALAAFAQACGFTKGASEALFAVGRTAGWIAHAMEVYARPPSPPPEFVYSGEPARSETATTPERS